MATMYVSLPHPMTTSVEAEAKTERGSDADDGVRDAIRRDQESPDSLTALRHHLDGAEASGISSRGVTEIVAEARAIARARGLPG